MTARKKESRVEPAHSLIYDPSQLAPVGQVPDTAALLSAITPLLDNSFNEKQARAFHKSFADRLSLLWGPPGTGKTTVLAGIIMGWLERAIKEDRSVCICVGSSNYNAIDNVLVALGKLLRRRHGAIAAVRLIRVRGEHSDPPSIEGIEDVPRPSASAERLADDVSAPDGNLVVAGTWMQLSKIAQRASETKKDPAAPWFDLIAIDEASQVPVANAAGYFMLAKPGAHVVLAGDHKQLGPIYGFNIRETSGGLFDCVFTYMKETHKIDHTALDQNYRTNLEISGWPRERFYKEGYDAFFPRRRLDIKLPSYSREAPEGWPKQVPWSPELLRLLNPSLPVTVITYRAQTYTVSNAFEAQMVAALSLLYRHALMVTNQYPGDQIFFTERLGIVTPHRAQMSSIRNLLASGMSAGNIPFVDTVDRFQGQERDMMVASYAVADKDFVSAEEEFILSPRRFNVTLTRSRCKFVMFVSDSIIQHLPSDPGVAEDAAHLQLFVESYCRSADVELILPYYEDGRLREMRCRMRGHSRK